MHRLALFLPNLQGGGAERAMAHLARGLAELGYPVDLVVAVREGPYLNDIPANVRLVDLGLPGPSFAPALFPLVRYLWRERPALLLSALRIADILAAVALRMALNPCPHLVGIHTDLRCIPTFQPRSRYWQLYWLTQILYPGVRGFLPVSNGAREGFLKAYKVVPSKLLTLYNPAIPPELPALAAQPVDHPWLQQGQPPVILAVGRLSHEKRFDLLVRAFAQVKGRREARLIILGQGPLLTDLHQLAATLGVSQFVDFPGFDPNPYRYMQRAAVFALTSESEGLPTVIIEALATGLPVVSTDCPSGPRELLQGGKWGQLVPTGSPQAIAEALEIALERGRVIEQPVAGALEEHLSQFTIEHAARAFIRALEYFKIRLPPIP